MNKKRDGSSVEEAAIRAAERVAKRLPVVLLFLLVAMAIVAIPISFGRPPADTAMVIALCVLPLAALGAWAYWPTGD